jgi:hypothetical protein
LIGSYELLMRQVRHAAARKRPIALQVPAASTAADEVGSYRSHTRLASDEASYDTHTVLADAIRASYDPQTDGVEESIEDADDVHPPDSGKTDRGPSRPRRSASELQHRAWQWAIR